MKRRKFIIAAFGTVSPLATPAQTAGKLHRIGWLDYSSAAENLGTFVQATSRAAGSKGRRSSSNTAARRATANAC